MSVRWVVFDAVGTLIEPDPDAATAYYSIGRSYGSQHSFETVAARFRTAFQADEERDRASGRLTTSEDVEAERWQRIVSEVLDDVDEPDRCFQDLFDHFGRPESWRCFDDVADTLNGLAGRGFRLAVASNFDRRLHPICDQLGALRRIECRIVSSEVGWRKPAGQFYEALTSAVSTPAREILVVGDDVVNDVDAAGAAGLKAVHLDRRQTTHNAVATFDDAPIASLTELLERLT